MPFKIDKKFLKSSHHIIELKLCSIRLHDNSKFPWVILIPKRNKITDISDLNSKDQILLMKEIVHVSKIMKKLFKTSKLNIEKIGNIVEYQTEIQDPCDFEDEEDYADFCILQGIHFYYCDEGYCDEDEETEDYEGPSESMVELRDEVEQHIFDKYYDYLVGIYNDADC